ncbi:hypothetical protein [Neisseria mucosa]|uniref:hypothetical protein n=1 Tax=Neisseria mucosa TaxID=488 RepID=UPI000ABEE726|nr:hypothetical protein [Neisseria mucosa]
MITGPLFFDTAPTANRHSRAGGNPSLNFNNAFRASVSWIFQWIPAIAHSRVGGEGMAAKKWGMGWL